MGINNNIKSDKSKEIAPTSILKKKYVNVKTNVGLLHLELNSETKPQICENFLIMCEAGFYDNASLNSAFENSVIQCENPYITDIATNTNFHSNSYYEFEHRFDTIKRGALIISRTLIKKGKNESKFNILC